MIDDKQLRAKLAKIQALFRVAGSPREKTSAAADMDRLQHRLSDSDGDDEPEIELKLSLPNMWSGRLFMALCGKHDLNPYRYAWQRRTAVMVRVQKRLTVSARPLSN